MSVDILDIVLISATSALHITANVRNLSFSVMIGKFLPVAENVGFCWRNLP